MPLRTMLTSFGLHYSGPTTPLNTVAPAITGTATSGSTLTCSTGTWLGVQPITFAYQWYRDSVLIAGETNNTYTIISTDIGFSFVCTVTATNSLGSTSADSNSIFINATIPAGTIIMYDGADPSISGWTLYSNTTNRYIRGTGTQGNINTTYANTGNVSGTIAFAPAGGHGSISGTFKTSWIAYPGTFGSSQALTSGTAGAHVHTSTISNTPINNALPWTSDFTFLVASTDQTVFPANTIHMRDTAISGWTQKLATNPGSPTFSTVRNIRGTPGSTSPTETALVTAPITGPIITSSDGSHSHFIADTAYRNPATGTSLGGGSYLPPSPSFVGSNPAPSPDGQSHAHSVTATYYLKSLQSKAMKLWVAAAQTGVLSNTMCLYSGTLNSLPSYWKLCDGFDGTPNMTGFYLSHSSSSGTSHGATISKSSEMQATAAPYSWPHHHGYGTGSVSSGGYATKDYWHTSGSSSHSHSYSSTPSITDTYTTETVELAFIQYTPGSGSLSTYSITPSANTVDEGNTITFTVSTTNVVDGSSLSWVIDDITANGTSDLGTTGNNVTINSGTATFTVTPTADGLTEGNQTFTVSVKRGDSIVATSETITIIDTFALSFTATSRTMSGYAPVSRTGWTLGTLIPSSYDDGFAGPYTSVMPAGTSWFMNNTAYNSYYVSSNGLLTFGAGTASGTLSALSIAPCPGDQYWGRNGSNIGSSNQQGMAYKFGTTSTGYYFFSVNMQGWAYGTSYTDRSWEINCFWNADNSKQYIEIIYSPAFGSNYSGTAGVYGGSSVGYSGTTYATPDKSMAFSSTNKGVNWTLAGQGSWTGVGTF